MYFVASVLHWGSVSSERAVVKTTHLGYLNTSDNCVHQRTCVGEGEGHGVLVEKRMAEVKIVSIFFSRSLSGPWVGMTQRTMSEMPGYYL